MTPYQASKLLFFMWGENMGFIYKITNDVNGKVYIGKTLNTVESRWKEHCHDKDRRNMENRPLYRAMNTASLFSKMGIIKVKNIIHPTLLLLGQIVFLIVVLLVWTGKDRKDGAVWNL